VKSWCAILFAAGVGLLQAEPPGIEYIYPAGAQRGTTVPVRVGGYYFHGQANFEMLGTGVKFRPQVKRIKTVWFEGPLIHQPLSQRGENYPKDHANEITVASDAELGHRFWRCWTSQGVTRPLKFVVGDLPEVMEEEMDGRPLPQEVTLPVTVNGRLFPREDIDIWTFEAKAGETIVCDAAAKRFGSPVNLVLEMRGPDGRRVTTRKTMRGGDPVHWFKAGVSGRYQVHLRDAKYWGLQNHIYRLTLKQGPHILTHYPLGAQRGTTVQAEFHGPALEKHTAKIVIPAGADEAHAVSVKDLGQVKFVVGEYPELIEPATGPVQSPVVLNGRILQPGQTDQWQLQLEEKQTVSLDLAAAQMGSPLDAVLSIHDIEDKQLATNDDRAKGQPDPKLEFTAKVAGIYILKVRERFHSRGGPAYAYRLTVESKQSAPDFSLSLSASHLNVFRDPKGGLETNTAEIVRLEKRLAEIDEIVKAVRKTSKKDPKMAERIKELSAEKRTATSEVKKLKAEDAKRRPKFKVALTRHGDFKGEVKLTVQGLPNNVTVHNTLIAAGAKEANLEFIAPANTPIAAHPITITGTGELADQNATRTANTPQGMDHLLLGVVPVVPFKHKGVYRIITAMPGGSTYHRAYELQRGGFEGSLTVRLADKQIRHLQGVTDQMIQVPAGVDQFKYPYNFSARVEVGRTSRLQVMLVGEMTDFDGTKHKISYTSNARDDQLISVAAEGNISVEPKVRSFLLGPKATVEVKVKVGRANEALKQPLIVELQLPPHIRDVHCEPVQLSPYASVATLRISTGPNPGPYNQPIAIRASTAQGPRHVGEGFIELVKPVQ